MIFKLNKLNKKKKSIWYMIELFFSIMIISYFLVQLIFKVNDLSIDEEISNRIYEENLYINFLILVEEGIVDKFLKDYNIASLIDYFRALYPYPNKNVNLYAWVYVPFSVVETNTLTLNDIRSVKFHYFLPNNVNNESIIILDKEMNYLDTKVEFNYYYSYLSYNMPNLLGYNCIYMKLKLSNEDASSVDFKKSLIYINNYRVKDFEWEKISSDTYLIKINELINSLGNDRIYFLFSREDSEEGKALSNSLDISNCKSYVSSTINMKLKKSNLATIYFNYRINYLSSDLVYLFYLKFLINKLKDSEIKEFSSFRSYSQQAIISNDSAVSISFRGKTDYGNEVNYLNNRKVLKKYPLYYSDGNKFFELWLELYE